MDETEIPAAEVPGVIETPEETPAAPTTDEIADLRKKADAFEDQKKRAEKAEGELKKLKPKPTETPAPKPAEPANDDVVRARLETRGVMDEEEQNLVIEAAQLLKISPFDALKRPLVQKQLEEMRAEKKTKDATPPPTKGTGSSRSSGKLPDFSKMSNAEFDEWQKKNR